MEFDIEIDGQAPSPPLWGAPVGRPVAHAREACGRVTPSIVVNADDDRTVLDVLSAPGIPDRLQLDLDRVALAVVVRSHHLRPL